jgi:D-3-phosphoglycerate dehydrogenase
MRILVADKLPAASIDHLQRCNFEVVFEPQLKDHPLEEALAAHNPQILVVRSTRVTASHVNAAPGLALVIRAGAGVNTIDLPSCSAHGIYVANCPGKNAIAVAELTLGLMMAIDRSIPDNVRDLRAQTWNKKKYAKANGLHGQSLGLLGLGQIGRQVARRAQAMGMQVVAWSPSLNEEKCKEFGIQYAPTPLDVASNCQILSVHLALKEETRGLVDADLLDRLPNGATFINTSRAEVVEEEALLEALNAGRLRAGLDVFSGEPQTSPSQWEHPLASHPAVYGTHHIGASTQQAQEAIGSAVCDTATEFRDHGRVTNCVNLARKPVSNTRLIVRHLDRVGVLASVLSTLRSDGISVGTMENLIFEGNEAACARIQLRGRPSEAAISLMQKQPDILSVSLLDTSS